MKKILLFAGLLCSIIASAQGPPSNYTKVSTTSYNWGMPGVFTNGIGVTADTGFVLRGKQWVGAGQMLWDSVRLKLGVFQGGAWYDVGKNVLNTGSGFRIIKPASQEAKTLYNNTSTFISWDSALNANGLTPVIDTTGGLTTRDRTKQVKDSLVALINARTLQVVTTTGNRSTNALVIQGKANGSTTAGSSLDFSTVIEYNDVLGFASIVSRGFLAGTALQQYGPLVMKASNYTIQNVNNAGNLYTISSAPVTNIDSTSITLFSLNFGNPWSSGVASYNPFMLGVYGDGSIFTKKIRHATAASVDTFIVRESGHFKYLTKAEMQSLMGGGGGSGGGVNFYNSDSALTGPRRVRGMGYPVVFDSLGAFRVRQFSASGSDSTIFEINHGLDVFSFTSTGDTSMNYYGDVNGGIKIWMAKASASRQSGWRATLDSLYDLGLNKSNDSTTYKVQGVNPVTGAKVWMNWLYAGGGGISTVGTYSGSGDAKGLSISGSTITAHPATLTTPGSISLSAQYMGLGTKTFSTSDGTGQAFFQDTRGGGETSAMLSGTAGTAFYYTESGYFGIGHASTPGGFSGGSGNVVIWPAGSPNAHFGDLLYTQTDLGGQVNILPSTTSKQGLKIFLNASQTGDAFQVLNSSSAVLSRFNASGYLGIGVTTPARPLHVQLADAVTNTIVYSERTEHSTSGTAAVGFGVGKEFSLENSSGTMKVASTIESVWLTPTNGAEDADITFNTIKDGSIFEVARLKAEGGFRGRITPRVTSISSSATPTPNADTDDYFKVTALATNPTFAAPTGTIYDGQIIIIYIKDDGTPRTLAWNAIYRAGDIPLPTITVTGKVMKAQIQFDQGATRWDLIGLVNNL